MNKIKILRNITGLSQKEFADRYGLSVRTLQQWEQGISRPVAALTTLIENDITKNSNLRHQYIHQDKDHKICIKDPFMNCEKIYPIQQRKVKTLITDLTKDKNVIKIIVFGSSVNNRCHIGSDVDIYYETTNKNTKLKNNYDFEYDLWNNHNVDKRLMEEINKKGVVVYE